MIMMNRRDFIANSAWLGGCGLFLPLTTACLRDDPSATARKRRENRDELKADLVIVGGGLGGCATALAACRNGLRVILTEETDWIGGQSSQQGVPPDEHPWIETHGAPASYRTYREGIRDFYRRYYPLTEEARKNPTLNPGSGGVSRICHEPAISVEVLMHLLMPYIGMGRLQLLLNHRLTSADTQGDEVGTVTVEDRLSGDLVELRAPYFVDATELGDLLPLTGTEYVTGSEAQAETRELHAGEKADPTNNQAFTVCFAVEYLPGEDWTIDKPQHYAFWHDFVPNLTPAWTGPLLSLTYPIPSTLKPNPAGFIPDGSAHESNWKGFNFWKYRQIVDHTHFLPGTFQSSATLVNWPQNDYMLGNIVDVAEEEFLRHVSAAKELNLALLYWLQTEAPRPDGGQGWKGLRLCQGLLGTRDGMAKYPYIREARRIRAEFTILEEHVGRENRKLVSGEEKAACFADSVGVGYYHIDLHPTCGGDNYIDFDSLPYQIPLGALIPQRMNNLLPVCKNIGTTHITNGCYRLHPTEWGIGEAVGQLVAYAMRKKCTPRAVRNTPTLLEDFQREIQKQGIEIAWKE